MRSEQEIGIKQLQEGYQKLMFGDEKSVGLLDVHKHLSDSINKISGNNSETKFDFEKESNCIFGISKKTIPMILDFRQALSSFQESSQNITMPYNECMELSSNLSGVAETIKNSILQIGNELEQYDHLLDQKLKNMYAVDVKQVDLVSVLNVAETFSAERNFSEKFHSAAKELTRTLDRDVKQIQKQLEENINKEVHMEQNRNMQLLQAINDINQTYDKLIENTEMSFVENDIYMIINNQNDYIKGCIKSLALDLYYLAEQKSIATDIENSVVQDDISTKMLEIKSNLSEIKSMVNLLPQNHNAYIESYVNFINIVDQSLEMSIVDDVFMKYAQMIQAKENDHFSHLKAVSSWMISTNDYMELELKGVMKAISPLVEEHNNAFLIEISDFLETTKKDIENISEEFARQGRERETVNEIMAQRFETMNVIMRNQQDLIEEYEDLSPIMK